VVSLWVNIERVPWSSPACHVFQSFSCLPCIEHWLSCAFVLYLNLTALICFLRLCPDFDSRPKDWIFLGCLCISEGSLEYAASTFFLRLLTHQKSLFFTLTAYNTLRWENVWLHCTNENMLYISFYTFAIKKKGTHVSSKCISRYCRAYQSMPTVTCILVTFISNLGRSADCTEYDYFWYSSVRKFMLSNGISNYVMISSFHIITDLLFTDHLKH
jgi:hypothetical protein